MEIVKINKVNCDVKYFAKGCEYLVNSKKKLIDMSPEELDICYNYLLQGNDSPSTNYKKYTENHLVNLNITKPDTKMRPKEFDIFNGLTQVNYAKNLPVTKHQYSQSPPLLELPQNSSLVLPNKKLKINQGKRKRNDENFLNLNLSKPDTKMMPKEFDICNGLRQMKLPVIKNQYSQSSSSLELPQNSSLILPKKDLKVNQVQRKPTEKDLVILSKSDTKMRPKEFDICNGLTQVNYTKKLPVIKNQISQSPSLLELSQNSSLVLPNKELKIKQGKRKPTDKDLVNLNLSKPDTKMRPKEFDICNGVSQVNYMMKLPGTRNQYSQSPPLLEFPQKSTLVLPNKELKVKQVQRKHTEKDLVNRSKPDSEMRPKEFDIYNGLSQMKLPVNRNQYLQSPPLLELPQNSSLILPNKELKVKQVQRKPTEKDLANLSKSEKKMKPKEFDICNGLTQVNYAKNLPVRKNQYSQAPPLLGLPQMNSLVLPKEELKIKLVQRKRVKTDGLSPVVDVDHSNTISNSEVSRKQLGQKRKYSSRKTENIN